MQYFAIFSGTVAMSIKTAGRSERKRPMATSYHPSLPPDGDDEEYTVVPVIPTDYLYHTDEHPECFESDCDCHQERIADLTRAYQDGLVSAEDATRIASGKIV